MSQRRKLEKNIDVAHVCNPGPYHAKHALTLNGIHGMNPSRDPQCPSPSQQSVNTDNSDKVPSTHLLILGCMGYFHYMVIETKISVGPLLHLEGRKHGTGVFRPCL